MAGRRPAARGGEADVGGVHNPSDARGGTLRFASSGDWDSLDPADTYLSYSWNFVRNYGRALVMFRSAPGQQGATLVPDLAEALGRSSDGAKTWTYSLRQGVKFEDGTSVTSKDVKCFTTGISYIAEDPSAKAVAEALQQSLARAGIKLEIKPYPGVDYTRRYAGKPDFAKSNDLGLILAVWNADWPDGYGFLAQLVDSRVIRATGGNTNLGVKDSAIDQMLDQALVTTDPAARNQIWAGIDRKGG